MNENIKDLIRKAHDVVEFDYDYPQEIFNKRKFAELVIRECIRLAGPEDSYRDEWFNCKSDSVNKIKKHFGIE
jgi:hypothetical protein